MRIQYQRNPIVPFPTQEAIAQAAAEWCGEPIDPRKDVLTVRNLLAGHRFGCERPGPVGVCYRALRQCCARPGAKGKRAAVLVGHDVFRLFDVPPSNPGKELLKRTVALIYAGDIGAMRALADELQSMLDDDPSGQYPPHAQGRGFYD